MAVLVLGDNVRIFRLIAAKVEKIQGLAVEQDFVAILRDMPLMEIPLGDVVTRVPEYVNIVEISWHKIHPLLVYEKPSWNIDHTFRK